MEDLGTGLVAAFLGLWLAFTVRYARPRGPRELGGFWVFGLMVPSWNFFAPKPGVYDYYLLYRDRTVEGGSAGPWREVPGLHGPRSRLAFLWNPDKLARKALFDITMTLIDELPDDLQESELGKPTPRLDTIKLSVPYLALVNYVEHLPKTEFSMERQFVIMQGDSVSDTLEPVIVSAYHSLQE